MEKWLKDTRELMYIYHITQKQIAERLNVAQPVISRALNGLKISPAMKQDIFWAAKELADEFNVTVRTIQNDIQALSLGFPIYTRQGGDGGIFVGDNYKPYMNTLTPLELKVLHEMYGLADGIHKKVLFQVLRKYGPDKLQL